MPLIEIGCCGAYCRTCPALRNKSCKGCKIGYDNGARDLNKVKCSIKICCMQHRFNTCADCPDLSFCQNLQSFYSKQGYKYRKYQQATAYIRQHGYRAFFNVAEQWTNAYGKYLSE